MLVAQRLAGAAAFAAFVLAGVMLATGGAWLAEPTALSGIPVGNLVAWVFQLALPAAAWLWLRGGPLGRMATAVLWLGVLWLPISILLAGNVELNFSGGWKSLAWIVLSAACVVLPLVLMAGWIMVRPAGH
jgi:hypothetical protein